MTTHSPEGNDPALQCGGPYRTELSQQNLPAVSRITALVKVLAVVNPAVTPPPGTLVCNTTGTC